MARNWKWFAAAALTVMLVATGPVGAEEEKVDNENYKSWAKHQPGTQITGSMQMNVSGQQMTTELTQKLVEVTPEKAVIEVTTKMNIPGVNVPPQTQKQDIPAKVAKENAGLGALPEGVKGEVKDVGTEKVEIDGKSYDCKVTEFTGEKDNMKMTGKTWTSADIPGGAAKMESKGDGAQKFDMKMSIDKIEVK